jgi:hypothetical protein
MDDDYQKQLVYIKNSTMSVEDQQIATTALEAEYNLKRRELAKQEAEQKKLTSIASTIINVAEAVAAALKAGPLLGPILAGVIGALGLYQLSLIRSTVIPLAKGAIFNQPSFMTSGRTGQEYQVAEGGEAEILSSPSKLREAIFGKGGQGGRSTIIQNHIYIDGREMKQFTVRTIEAASQTGNLRLAGKAVS